MTTKMSKRTAYSATALAGIMMLLALVVSCVSPPPGPVALKPQPFVRGYIAVEVPQRGVNDVVGTGARLSRDVYLPMIKVHLLNLLDDSRGDAVTTDLSGRFTLPVSAGRYRICWEGEGFAAGCSKKIVSVGSDPVHVSTIRIDVLISPETTVVYGRVQLSEGSSFRLLEPFADINIFGQVRLLDATNTTKYTALVNNFRDYLIPNVPVKANVSLVARVENGTVVQEIKPQANLAGAPFHSIDLTINNARPRVRPLIPRHASGDRVQVAAPGETVTIEAVANDPDGDAVKFRWLLGAGSGTLSSTTDAAVKWQLPATGGLYTVTLIASDEKGGHARHNVSIRADTKGVVFSGHVISTGGGPVAGAKVTVNGSPTTTDSTGFFRFHVPAEDRYVLNVHKHGFGLLSHILDRGVTGGRYQLLPATVTTVDPTQDIYVVDERSRRNCPGPASLYFDRNTFPGGVTPIWQDGKGNVIAPGTESLPSLPRYRKSKGCGDGVRVRLPANSIEDANGNPPIGPVQISVSTVDPMSPDQMPGDYTVALSAGGTQVMESYGAATIDITSGTTKFNLKSGAFVEVTIPVDPAQLAAGAPLDPTIPLLLYDEVKGVWREDTVATLQGTAYVAKISHLSTVNTDVLKTNQACVSVDASDPGLPGSFRMQVIVPRGANIAPRVVDQPIDNSLEKEHAIYNLPPGVNITVAPYDAVTRVPFGTFVVNTGGIQNPTDPNKPFGPPYSACATTVVLTPQVLPDDPISGEFLHGIFSFAATELVETDIVIPGTLSNQLDTATANYYAQVDPTNTRLTLDGVTGFKTHHGFGPAGPSCTNLAAGETCAIFANSGDLGFGREMHCKKNGADVACYVTNYGNIDTPDTDDVAAAVANDNKVATVAMEYAPIEGAGADPVVKFFVYNAVGDRVNNADLDNKGRRPIPQLCMVCHGGNYPGGATTGVPPFSVANDAKLGSQFIAFDVHNYTFAAPPFDKSGQQAAFKTFNEQIVLATNASQHTSLVIAEMYDGDNGFPATDQEELLVIEDLSELVPADRWTGAPSKQEMYKHVVGNACRTCHATHPVPTLRFTTAKQMIDRLGQVETRVCSEHVMPHAKVTHDLFWLSVDDPDTLGIEPHQPGILQAFGDDFGTVPNGWQGNLCGVFTGGAPTPPSAFNDIKDDIFTPKCSGCHLGGAPAGNMNLQAANAHAQIVNISSCERPVMDRVEPGFAADSYLYRKVLGDHTGLSGCDVSTCNPFGGETGCGFQMPWTNSVASSSPLSGAELLQIENWINVGAPN